jgi:hypothetical protein
MMQLSKIDARLQRLALDLACEGAAPIDIARTALKIGTNMITAMSDNQRTQVELETISAQLNRTGQTYLAVAGVDDLKGQGAN